MVAVAGLRQRRGHRFAGTQGNFELNVFKPVIMPQRAAFVRLLADAIESFTEHCVGH